MPGDDSSNALAIVLGQVLSFSPSELGFGPHFYEVQFEAGTTYTVDLVVDTLWLSVVSLHRNDLANLGQKVGDSLASRIVWTAERSGPYFVKVTGPRGLGSYALTVTEGENLGPPTLALLPTPVATPTDAPSTSPTPTPSVPALTFAAVSAGDEHTCGITTSGTAYCWGYGEYGQLGNGTTSVEQMTPTAVSGGLTFTSVNVGSQHACGITTNGDAYCWGRGDEGELGNGSTDDQWTPVAISGGLTSASVSAGFDHTCGVTTSGAAYCWGWEFPGKLGNGLRMLQSAPVPVSGPQ